VPTACAVALKLAAFRIYAAETARFALTEVTLGIMPGAGGANFCGYWRALEN
jgi:enoyl-CoA hydratase/carnithine racemase